MLLDILVFDLTISQCTCLHKWRRTIICCWISQYFDNILLYRYAFWVLDHYIILLFDLYHVYIVHMHVRALLSDDESVVSVTRKEQQLEQTCLTICFMLLFCFVMVLFCFYLCLFVQDSSCSIIIYMCGVVFRFGHCIAFPSIYGFGLPLWYLQTFILPIMSY